MRHSEPIVAVATPSGVGGVAVVRLSGERALAIALECLTAKHLHPRHATLTHIIDGDRVLDEAVATLYPAPHSYTGEETVELSCHGSLYVQEAVLQLLVNHGARLAEPGEYTRRAFMNGKLNLSQAEAVADLIDATTPAQHRLAISQLRGGYADELKTLRQHLLELTSLLELELDFSQEDVEFANRDELQALLTALQTKLTSLTDSFRLGNAIKNGIPVAIVGEPNAGKSTLLNALLHDDRAIVSPIPGTTRDTIEETLLINGTPFRIIDTAGLHHSDDPVEQLGIVRSRRAIEEAHLVLVVTDSPQTGDGVEWILRDYSDKCLLVRNKADLMPQPHYGHTDPACIHVSALQGLGIDELKQAIADSLPHQSDGVLLSNSRHLDALRHVEQALDHVAQSLRDSLPADLMAVDLRDALYHLGTITGDITNDELLGNIFSRFCIGK